MVDVLLVHAPDASGDPRKGPPLALAYLSAQLQAKGWTTRLVDLNLVSDWRRLLPAWLQADAPRLVGISSTAFSLDLVRELASLCKQWDAAVPVIAGGYCGLLPSLRDIGALDAICVGEGDWVLCEIMENLARGGATFGGIASLHYRDESGQWVENARRSLLSPADLDNLPFPDFNGIEPARYGEVPAVPLYVQRGCYNACRFCDVAPFYASQRIREMSPARVVEWMLRAKDDFGATHVQFMDDDFLSRPGWFAELATKIKGEDGTYAIQANFQTRPGDILRAKTQIAAHVGFLYQVELGVESFSSSQLDRWGKHQRPAEAYEAIAFLTILQVPTLAYLIFSDRETTLEELRENIAHLKTCPPLCSFPDRLAVPAVVVCHDINTTYTLTGEREIAGVPFLEAFDVVLQETEEAAGRAYYFYIALQAAVNQSAIGSVTREIGFPLLGLVEQLFANRLEKAFEAASKVFRAGLEWKTLATKASKEVLQNFDALAREIARLPRELQD